jgi:hypothetical protein
MSAQSIKKAERPKIVTTLGTKLEIIAGFEAQKREMNARRELRIPPATVSDK